VISPGFCTAQLCDAHLKDWRVVRSIGWRVSRRFEFNFDLSITVHDPKSNKISLRVRIASLDKLPGNKAVGMMKAGQTFTIEPMINAGKSNCPLVESALSV
jgi:hypothetical protein